MTLVVNLYGGPGARKSTYAYMVAGRLKQLGIEAELVTEYAKDMVWWEAEKKLDNQIYVFGKQHSRLKRLLGKVDVIVTDSPILMCIAYENDGNQPLRDLIGYEYSKMNNLDIFLNRVGEYNPIGRLQTEEQAIEIDNIVRDIMTDHEADVKELPAQKHVDTTIVDMIAAMLVNTD